MLKFLLAFACEGVDLSECLQYPDFSVVVLYKKVVIGFGFMVPDVKYNEAYISFLLVHPEWRRAGIATFMIYHLIQVRGKIVMCFWLYHPVLLSFFFFFLFSFK